MYGAFRITIVTKTILARRMNLKARVWKLQLFEGEQNAKIVSLISTGLPWEWNFNFHSHPIPTGFPTGFP